METINTEDKVVAATKWRSFISYLIRLTPNTGFARLNMSFLLHKDIPVSWKVTVEEFPVYIDIDGGGDIESQWQAFGRHILYCAKDNGGLAVATATVLTHDRRPLIWPGVNVSKLYPRTMANEIGQEIIGKYLLPNHVSI